MRERTRYSREIYFENYYCISPAPRHRHCSRTTICHAKQIERALTHGQLSSRKFAAIVSSSTTSSSSFLHHHHHRRRHHHHHHHHSIRPTGPSSSRTQLQPARGRLSFRGMALHVCQRRCWCSHSTLPIRICSADCWMRARCRRLERHRRAPSGVDGSKFEEWG